MFVCNFVHYTCNNLNDTLRGGSEFYTAGGEKKLSLAGFGQQAQALRASEKKALHSPSDKKAIATLLGSAQSHMGELLLVKSRTVWVPFFHATNVCWVPMRCLALC